MWIMLPKYNSGETHLCVCKLRQQFVKCTVEEHNCISDDEKFVDNFNCNFRRNLALKLLLWQSWVRFFPKMAGEDTFFFLENCKNSNVRKKILFKLPYAPSFWRLKSSLYLKFVWFFFFFNRFVERWTLGSNDKNSQHFWLWRSKFNKIQT